MALTDESGNMIMPVTPMNGGGMGGFGSDWGWIILLLLFAGGGFGGFNGGDNIYPWMNQADITTSGFQNAATNQAISSLQNSVTSGFGDVATALCGGFAGVNASVNNAQNGITQQMYGNQIADLERSFNAQTANTAGLNAIQTQMSSCCCQTQNMVQSEGAQTRLAIQAQTQAILDKMCQQEIDALKAQNLALQNQLNMANLQASQVSQTAQIIADNTAQTQYIVNRVSPYPVPAYLVNNPVTPSY